MPKTTLESFIKDYFLLFKSLVRSSRVDPNVGGPGSGECDDLLGSRLRMMNGKEKKNGHQANGNGNGEYTGSFDGKNKYSK